MMQKSTVNALTRNNVVVAKGSAKSMRSLRKANSKNEPGAQWLVWLAPTSKVGDTLR